MMGDKKEIPCHECGEPLWPWTGSGQASEIYTCQNPHCDIIKVLIVRKEDLI